MLTMVEVRTETGQSLQLPLQGTASGYVVREIEGLDPVKASLVSSRRAQVDGTVFQASRRDDRNIVIRLGFEPDYVNTTIRALRQALYRFLMPKSDVILRFFDDDEAFVDISGKVESFETSLFSKDPQVDISILCFDPDFYDLDTTVVTGTASTALQWSSVEYDGSVETGFELELHVQSPMTGFTVILFTPDNAQPKFEFAGSLLNGDVVKVDTRVGSKGVVLRRAGTESSILYGVTPASTWLMLQPGSNNIRVQLPTGEPNMPWELRYVSKYGGL